MFESHKQAESKQKEAVIILAQEGPVQDFLQIWQAMKAEIKDRIRLKRLELRMDAIWQAFTQDQRDAIWMVIFPEHRAVKDVFDAHAMKIGYK